MSDGTFQEKHPRARKPHACGECRRMIRVGETYARVSGVEGGDLWSAKLCAHCDVVAEHVLDVEGWVWYGGVYEALEGRAGTWTEYRYMIGMRRKWTRKNGTLMPVPGSAT